MKMNRLNLLPLFLALCILFSGCGNTDEQEAATKTSSRQEEFYAFLDTVNESRRTIYTNETAPALEDGWTPELAADFNAGEIEKLLTAAPSRSVSAEEAAADVKIFFTLLKNCYGAYDYFGGDEVFLPLQEDVLACLPSIGTVSPFELERLLARQISPILIDGHFLIGGTRLGISNDKYMYYVHGVFFDDAGNIDPKLVKPTVDGEGRLCLGLATVATPTEAVFLPTSLEIEGQTVSLQWKRDASAVWDGLDVFTESEREGGTPWLTSSAMYSRQNQQQSQLERLAACGTEYAASPLLVLDVRGNGGGSDWYINEWFHGYTGQYPDCRLAYAQKLSAANLIVYERLGMNTAEAPCWGNRINSTGSWVKHDGITLVLQDKGTASSGETAVKILRTLENTLFLGSNTLGCSLVANNVLFYLPNSHLDVRFGTALLLYEDGENFDGLGLMPDLWVPSEDAADAAQKLINYYRLSMG